MDKFLIEALENYTKASRKVLKSMAEAHYVAGDSNRDFIALCKAGDELLVQLEKAKTPATPAPAPAAAT